MSNSINKACKFWTLLLLFSVYVFSQSVVAKTKILFLGDSLTEGYGVAKSEAYPTLIQNRFQKDGNIKIQVINAGISGSTSTSAIARLKWFSRVHPQIVVLVLGGNDGLRGLPVDTMKKNLAAAIRYAQKSKMKVLIAEIDIPPNYGDEYRKKFRAVFSELAKEFDIPMIPFLREVARSGKKMLPDGIHPNALGHQHIAKIMYNYLIKML